MTYTRDPYIEQLLAEGAARRKKTEALMRDEHFASNPTYIPDLDMMPDCSICGSFDMQYEEGFWCAGCGVRWDRNGTQGEIDPDALDNWH